MNDARVRLRYLSRTVGLLFPTTDGEPRPYSLLPHRTLPRRLAPRAWWHPGRRVLVPSGHDTIETYLGQALGAPVRVVLHVRPAVRANRKPILEAHTRDGLAAFVKIGDTARVRDLVTHEARTLAMLADTPLKTVVAPTVLHHGTWRGLSVLALSPLPVRRGPRALPVPTRLLVEAVTEIAHLPVPPGQGFAWHGDLSPWNIARAADGRLLVWDWERFGTGVPLGFDAVHHLFHRLLRRNDPATAARACLAQALAALAPFGLSSAEARLTVIRYLIALADRHAADGHAPLGPPERWLNPVVDFQELLS
ncbi:hypothetical protein ACFY19_32605 [Streptosporangium saharense]|uniref:hypothetical protein n=1 Tax=Streptosporangium saharense TaxID=1706840 RepID=UPI0036CE2E22